MDWCFLCITTVWHDYFNQWSGERLAEVGTYGSSNIIYLWNCIRSRKLGQYPKLIFRLHKSYGHTLLLKLATSSTFSLRFFRSPQLANIRKNSIRLTWLLLNKLQRIEHEEDLFPLEATRRDTAWWKMDLTAAGLQHLPTAAPNPGAKLRTTHPWHGSSPSSTSYHAASQGLIRGACGSRGSREQTHNVQKVLPVPAGIARPTSVRVKALPPRSHHLKHFPLASNNGKPELETKPALPHANGVLLPSPGSPEEHISPQGKASPPYRTPGGRRGEPLRLTAFPQRALAPSAARPAPLRSAASLRALRGRPAAKKQLLEPTLSTPLPDTYDIADARSRSRRRLCRSPAAVHRPKAAGWKRCWEGG